MALHPPRVADRSGPADPGGAGLSLSGDGPAAIVTLTRRADFLRAASARRQGTPGFLLQARPRPEGDHAGMIRVGFTCSKKIGNAVVRNRAKRRLRAVARAVLPQEARAGWDYVLVGRPGATVERDFAAMVADLDGALARVHGNAPGRGAEGDNRAALPAAAGARADRVASVAAVPGPQGGVPA